MLITLQSKTVDGRLRMMVMVAASESERELEEQRLKDYRNLKSELRAQQEYAAFLAHAMNGLFSVTPTVGMQSYRVVEDLDMRNVLALCKHTIKNVDVDSIRKDNDRRRMSAR